RFSRDWSSDVCSSDLNKEELFNEQNNLIADVSIEIVYNYFKVLIEVPNRKGEFYLSEQKLLLFIKSTFIDLAPEKQNFNVSFSRSEERRVGKECRSRW